MSEDSKFLFNEVKTLVLIGGLPSLGFLIGLVIASFFTDNYLQTKIVLIAIVVMAVLSFFLILRRMFKNV